LKRHISPPAFSASTTDKNLLGRSAVQGELLLRLVHFLLFYAFLKAPQGFFSGLSANAKSTSGFSWHKPDRCRLSGPKSTGGDYLGVHPSGGSRRPLFIRRTGSGQSVRTFS